MEGTASQLVEDYLERYCRAVEEGDLVTAYFHSRAAESLEDALDARKNRLLFPTSPSREN